MSWINLHGHTIFCDGSEYPETYIQKAVENNMPVYGFSSHAPLPFATTWAIDDRELLTYRKEIKMLKSKFAAEIEVKASLEIDFIEHRMGPADKKFADLDLDYTIGSIHFISSLKRDAFLQIDSKNDIFKQGLVDFFNNDLRYAFRRYFELTRKMIIEHKPDIIGHLDKMKIQLDPAEINIEDEYWYWDEIYKTLKVIKENKSIVEVNTRGKYKGKTTALFPGRKVLQEIKEMGIPVMLSSDAHTPEEIIEGFPEAAKILRELGFKKITVLSDDQWVQKSFDESGIDI